MSYPFNVRVYGLLINEKGEVLLTDEARHGVKFSKFPGGGLMYGEGLIEALKREFHEECNVEIEVMKHFYTTDFFIKSAFDESQVISVYYYVQPKSELSLSFKDRLFDFDSDQTPQSFRWMGIEQLQPDDVTFPADKRVVVLLKEAVSHR